jgi:2',3'-cyclic-nucleotide 2'-phosphodiesterase (5'-nucleotidase family)
MGYAAINIGELEAIEETDRWSDLAGSDLPLVSANAIVPPSTPVQAPPYVIREIESSRGRVIRVGLLGLAAPAPGSLAIEFADPIERARSYAAELAGRVDVLVALAQMTEAGSRELVKAVPQIDIVIGAANDAHVAEPLFEGDSMILYPIPQGMSLGDLRLFFGDDGRPERFFYRLVPLPSQLEDHPDWVEFQRQAEAEINAAKSP